MRYIGPFLRINILNNENIKNQLFYFSKESLRHIVFHSGCGIICTDSDVKINPLPNDDNTTNSVNSPLLCVYRKADGKLIREQDKLIWNHRKFKKEINICANGYMTLSLLCLADYYRKFENIDKEKYNLYTVYTSLAAKQLEFYALNCRNCDGVFIDKYDSTDPLQKNYNLTDKDMKFRFSTQAILMAAYYKCALSLGEEGINFKNFALDILSLFKEYEKEICNLSHDELVKVCLALNILYEDSKADDVKKLLIHFSDVSIDNITNMPSSVIKDNITISCLCYINLLITYKSLGMEKYKKAAKMIYNILEQSYNTNLGIFIKDDYEKENKYSSDEIILYLYMVMMHKKYESSSNKNETASRIHNIYQKQVVNSGIILNWPEPPSLDDLERYRGFSPKPENLMDDNYFKTSPVGDITNELAPIFVKSISLNKKKESFKHYKHSFDSCKNMFNFFIIIYLNDSIE